MPVKKLGIMCGKITQRKICLRLAPHRARAEQQDRLDVLRAGDHVHDDRKDAVADAIGDLGGRADAEIKNEKR
jgi:hypothetical protein